MIALKSKTAIAIFSAAGIALISFILFQFIMGSHEPYVNLAERPPVEDAARKSDSTGRTLRFAVSSMWSVESTFSMYRRLSERIAKDVGLGESLILRPSYMALRFAIENDEVDVACVCTGPYVSVLSGGHIRLLVKPEFVKEEPYRSIIVVRSSSGINSVMDLRNMSIGFSDSESFAGYILPYVMLKERGLDPDRLFKKIVFTGSHDRSIVAVEQGLVEAAAVHSIVLKSAEREDASLGGRLREIWSSDSYGPPPVIVSTRLSKGFADSLEQAFLNLDRDSEGRSILSAVGMTRFVPARETEYLSAVNLYQRFGRMRERK